METPSHRISFAFFKFQGRRHSIYAYNRVYTPQHKGVLHSHDFPQLWYCLKGNYRHLLEDQEYLCSKGSVILVPSGVRHNFLVSEGEDVELISMDISYEAFIKMPAGQYINAATNLLLAPFAETLKWKSAPYRMLSSQSQQHIEDLLSWFCLLDYAPKNSVDLLQIYEKLEEIFSLPEFATPEKVRKKTAHLIQTRLRPVFQILSYINSHYSEKLEEEKLLREGGISRAGMYRYFKQITGHSYSQYLQQLRVRRAYIYLKFTTYSLSYIADVCGFYGTQHMLKVFTRYEGESPRQQRDRLKKMYENDPGLLAEMRQILLNNE